MKIQSLKAREVLDSRGNPTVEVDLKTENGIFRGWLPAEQAPGSMKLSS
jgi:enolase